jgi:hypothetical protein
MEQHRWAFAVFEHFFTKQGPPLRDRLDPRLGFVSAGRPGPRQPGRPASPSTASPPPPPPATATPSIRGGVPDAARHKADRVWCSDVVRRAAAVFFGKHHSAGHVRTGNSFTSTCRGPTCEEGARATPRSRHPQRPVRPSASALARTSAARTRSSVPPPRKHLSVAPTPRSTTARRTEHFLTSSLVVAPPHPQTHYARGDRTRPGFLLAGDAAARAPPASSRRRGGCCELLGVGGADHGINFGRLLLRVEALGVALRRNTGRFVSTAAFHVTLDLRLRPHESRGPGACAGR